MAKRLGRHGEWMRLIKVRGEWVYLYRAVYREGRTVDFRLSSRRNVAAAKAFSARRSKGKARRRTITLDGYAASHPAVCLANHG
ncbi:DDE-type integrase/transposase/recombinase [Acidisoma cellulosilytica]|uniref:DDE-type integrase/transposase/recombinase n=1 Tax=Acidisoma cellulosilyticum TaxID=2802395 RepID=A0A963Z8Z6_9PROT|nr:transposase [Acidisoma cellulosilyticum]MCB8884067.1 DDE-type integrase/transposase/recombinase [Acidisoma cellulosilyticum]